MAHPPLPDALRTIVILGSGAAAWIAAAALRRALPPERLAIRIVEPEHFDHGVGVGEIEASLPSLTPFLARIGIEDAQLVREAQGCFSLGTLFSGWAGGGEWFQPFGDMGAPIGPVAYHQLVMRLRSEGEEEQLERASLAATMARANRFAHPSPDPRSPLSSLSYGLHLSLDGLAETLGRKVKGVEVVHGRFRTAIRDEAGRVTALSIDTGAEVEGDLFIDCSGPSALLRSGPLESWSHWLPCDRISTAEKVSDNPPAPFSRHEASETGWTQMIPLRGRIASVQVYKSANGPADGALAYQPGMQSAPWTGNLVAIGSSAVALEPIARSGLHSLQTGIERLLRLLPVGDGHVEAAEYNRLAHEEAERLRDFAILPYKLNGRHGEPFWDACRAMDVPDSLARKIAQYQSRGRVPLEDGETFERDAWVFMFDGLGLHPRRYDPLADGLTSDQIRTHVSRIGDIFARTAAGLPTHRDYLQRIMGR